MSDPRLEPGAELSRTRAPGPSNYEIELSKAISLKRIADALYGDPSRIGIIEMLFELTRAQS